MFSPSRYGPGSTMRAPTMGPAGAQQGRQHQSAAVTHWSAFDPCRARSEPRVRCVGCADAYQAATCAALRPSAAVKALPARLLCLLTCRARAVHNCTAAGATVPLSVVESLTRVDTEAHHSSVLMGNHHTDSCLCWPAATHH